MASIERKIAVRLLCLGVLIYSSTAWARAGVDLTILAGYGTPYRYPVVQHDQDALASASTDVACAIHIAIDLPGHFDLLTGARYLKCGGPVTMTRSPESTKSDVTGTVLAYLAGVRYGMISPQRPVRLYVEAAPALIQLRTSVVTGPGFYGEPPRVEATSDFAPGLMLGTTVVVDIGEPIGFEVEGAYLASGEFGNHDRRIVAGRFGGVRTASIVGGLRAHVW